MVSHDDVREVALALPNTSEKPSYGGRPSWRTPKRMFIWIREDPEALVAWVDSEEEKLMLIDSEPDKFFTTDHYDGHPIVLVNLDAIDRDELHELVVESWRQRATKTEVKAYDAEHEVS